MKTLIISYLPSGVNSNTKQVLDIFINAATSANPTQTIENVDLLKAQIPVFNELSIQAYYKRNYGGQALNPQEAQLLAANDALISQLKSADNVIIACPMHNFGYPALVKAYIDAVVFNGETFAYDKKMMAGKKILTLFTSGGSYSLDNFNFNYPNWNTMALLAAATFGFMGFDDVKTLGTTLRDESTKAENLAKISTEISEIVNKWMR